MFSDEEWSTLKVGDIVYWINQANKIITLTIERFWENRSFLTAISAQRELFSICKISYRASLSKEALIRKVKND